MSTLIDVADAVVASLNAGTFDPPFTAVRAYQPVFELPDLQELRVSVVPKGLEITTAARQSGYFDGAVDIGVQRKVDPDDPAELDALLHLVEQIVDHLRMQRLPDLPGAAWLSVAVAPVFAPEHLEQWHQFTSVVTVTYRVRR